MSFLDSIKEFFGSNDNEHLQALQEQVNVEEIQQKAEELQQSMQETGGEVGEQVTQKVDELKEKLPGQK